MLPGRLLITGFPIQLLPHELHAKLAAPQTVASQMATAVLRKGSKLLDFIPPLLPAVCCYGGVVASGPKLEQPEIDNFINHRSKPGGPAQSQLTGELQTQVCGIPWSEQLLNKWCNLDTLVQWTYICLLC